MDAWPPVSRCFGLRSVKLNWERLISCNSSFTSEDIYSSFTSLLSLGIGFVSFDLYSTSACFVSPYWLYISSTTRSHSLNCQQLSPIGEKTVPPSSITEILRLLNTATANAIATQTSVSSISAYETRWTSLGYSNTLFVSFPSTRCYSWTSGRSTLVYISLRSSRKPVLD